jgi:flagellar protein FlaI
MFDLLKESFRQNPDYLIVGEIRGKEAYVMFQSMASGHPSISTMHAGSVDDVIRRLQTEPINLSSSLLETLDIVIVMIHAREKGKSARRVKEVVEIESIDQETGTPRISKVFLWVPSKDIFEYKGSSWVLNKISTDKGIPMNNIVREIAKRKKLIEWMVEKNIISMQDAAKYISMYYTNPAKIDKIIGKE